LKNRRAVLAVLLFMGSFAEAGIVLFSGGKTRCAVCFKEPELRKLAGELSEALRSASGVPLPVVNAVTPGPGIVLGTARSFAAEARRFGLSGRDPEEFVLRCEGSKQYILGVSVLGVQHGVYTFLEAIGFRWFFPDPVWNVVPELKDLTVSVNKHARPAFRYRRIWYGWGARTKKLSRDYELWLRHNRQLGWFKIHCGHSYAWHIPPALFKNHPEWFALVGGVRKPTQLCVSNPEVQKAVIEHTLKVFRGDPTRTMVSVEPNDGGGYCECPSCRALGTISDQVFFLANRVAEAVRAAFPSKWVGLYAYASHSDPPHFRLKPGVYVQVTTGFRYTDLSFEEQVRRFRDLGAAVGVYDYFSVYPWDWDLPGAAKAGRVYELAEAVRRYAELGLTTYSAESSCNWGPNGLGYWVAAHLMWDPKADPKILVEDFYTKAFGKAAPCLRRLYERWARGERFSPRSLKLSLSDLKEGYRREPEEAVRRRLDRLALYLHWLCLWLKYDQSSRTDQWGKLAVDPPGEVVKKARNCVVFARRIMDTGMIHAYPMLFSSWFKTRFSALRKVPGFAFDRETEKWKGERTDVPQAAEIRALLDADLAELAGLKAVPIEGRTFGGPLVRLCKAAPGAVSAWGEVRPSKVFVETARIRFAGHAGEKISLRYIPFDRNHTIDCKWVLKRGSEAVARGEIKAPKAAPATVEISLPEEGFYSFEPGTGYFRAAHIELGERPAVYEAKRADRAPGGGVPLRLWRPTFSEPLYLYVPKGTKHFVIGIVSGGDPFTRVELRTAAGRVIVSERVLAGSEISVIIGEDIRRYGERSAMGQNCVLPAAQCSVSVPEGTDGQVWRLSLDSLRCVLELYDIAPFVAASLKRLLVPRGALE